MKRPPLEPVGTFGNNGEFFVELHVEALFQSQDLFQPASADCASHYRNQVSVSDVANDMSARLRSHCPRIPWRNVAALLLIDRR